MTPQILIIIDRLARPFYLIMNALKWRGKSAKKQHFIVLKFFGLGSITRIVHVMNNTGVPKEQVTFITLHKNKSLVDLLAVNAIYVKTRNPLVLVTSTLKVLIRVWQQKQVSILDMERASNLSGLFRLMVGIGKPCHSFYFKPNNRKVRGQFFVSLQNKPATKAIAEMFGETYSINLPANDNQKGETNSDILININAGKYLPQRKFTLPEYASLVFKLSQINSDWHFKLTGAKSEFEFVESFKQRLIKLGIQPDRLSVLAGQHNLFSFVNQLKKSKLFITNDSGPLHLAYFFNAKTVCIWGPTSSELVGYQNSKLMLNIDSTISCSPCFIHPKSQVAKTCNGELTCFKSMNSKEMASKIIRFVEHETVKTF